MVDVEGLEPSPAACETAAPPLKLHVDWVPVAGVEPAASSLKRRALWPLSYTGMVHVPGVEPGATCVSGRPLHRLGRRGWFGAGESNPAHPLIRRVACYRLPLAPKARRGLVRWPVAIRHRPGPPPPGDGAGGRRSYALRRFRSPTWTQEGSNLRPSACHAAALPLRHASWWSSQADRRLSRGPPCVVPSLWWSMVDSNDLARGFKPALYLVS